MDKPHIERRKRDIERIKKQILQAARKLARNNGWQGVSIRNIAKEIEYTPPVIYEHYKDGKEEILATLERQGFDQLSESLKKARKVGKTPQEQWVNMSEAFWNFAFDNPDLYQVMFNLQGIQSAPADTKAIQVTGQSVLDSLKYLHTFPADRERFFLTWWAISHGYVSMKMSGQIPMDKEALKTHYLESMKDVLKGFG